MNFLLRNPHSDTQPMAKPATTLGGLIAEDEYTNSSVSDDGDKDSEPVGDGSGRVVDQTPTGSHSDVAEDEGWITIPSKELPEDWTDTSDILQLRSLDRSFVFPGEQVHILVCLTAAKQDTEVITPFKVAAVISKNGSSAQKDKLPTKNLESEFASTIIGQEGVNGIQEGTQVQGRLEENGGTIPTTEKAGYKQDISATESLLRMEDHKLKTERLLEKFRNSNFFVRIAQADEPLWSRRNSLESSTDIDIEGGKIHSGAGGSSETSRSNHISAVIDRGTFDGNTSGGAARSTAKCYSLSNGDIVVLLQVNITSTTIKDPVLEVLQFEKYNASNSSSENFSGLVDDPCRELLHWLLPLDRALPPPRPLSPPLSSPSVLASVSQRATPLSSSFSFGNFRSYSMSAVPQISPAVTPNTKNAFDLEDFDRFSVEKLTKSRDTANEDLLSFRGVPLVAERFSVHCGLEGIYLPGRRWRRKLEVIRPIEIHSFVADCATEDLLCVQIKNVSPAYIPDIVIFLDSITIVFEEASKGGPTLSLPIASIETGNGHSLPNLPLRRGEEHSFILKPVTTVVGDRKVFKSTNSLLSRSKVGVSTPGMHPVSTVSEGRRLSPSSDQYAISVSCRCNYTESKLFFMKPTSWRPRVARDLVISVASEISKQNVGPNGEAPQLPVQALTVQASNLTSEDLTLTVVAPISSNSSPSIMSLNSGPTTPMSPLFGFQEFPGRTGMNTNGTGLQRQTSTPIAQGDQKERDVGEKRPINVGARLGKTSDVITSTDLGCTHLWLQSTVPLGCVPARSNATVKLELLPLTDGIITLDTLQVAVKDKGQMYAPEKPLQIYVAPGISTGAV